MPKIRAVAESNPAFQRHTIAGDAGENSSLDAPTEHIVEADHAQFDEANVKAGEDPNIAGKPAMRDLYTWRAGAMTAWQENDDYREFGPGRMDVPESATTHRYRSVHDGDYDDNGGHPLAEGHSRGDYSHPADSQGIGLNAIIVRRV